MTTEAEKIQEQAKEVEQPTAPPDTDLNISDLNAMKQIIDAASSRGAFKASELGTSSHKRTTKWLI